MNQTLPIPASLKAFVTLSRRGQADTITVSFEGAAIAESDIAYGPEHGVNAWDDTLAELGYHRTTAWRGDDAGLVANVEAVQR